jgi:hypothetical protein
MTWLKSMWRYQNKYATVFAAAFAAIVIFNTYEGFEAIRDKRDEQEKSFATFDRYAKSYRALLPVKASWEKLFSPASGIHDVTGVYRLIDTQSAGLMSSVDTMSIKSVERVTSNGKDIGLTALCPKSSSRGTFTVAAASTGEILEGIRKLSDRADILIKDISLVSSAAGRVSAELSLCVLVRDDK